jgi:ADP-heptose:LPS heptosyltransferase
VAPDVAAYVAESVLPDVEARYVGLFPGAGHPSRCWPLERFAELADQLIAAGLSPVVLLGPEEKQLRPLAEKLFPSTVPIIDGLTIPRFVAAAARLAAFITNDTGPMHLAACAGSPIVMIADEGNPLVYLPLTDRIRVVREATIPEVTAEAVFEAFSSLISPVNDNHFPA